MSGGALEEAYAGREGGWNLCFLPIRVHIRCQIPLRTHIPDTLSPPFPVRGVVADHGLAVREDRYIAGRRQLRLMSHLRIRYWWLRTSPIPTRKRWRT